MLSNYNIKKMLPRLIAAIILANLSFELCYALINLTNIIGGAVFEIFKEVLPSSAPSNAGAIGAFVAASLGGAIGFMIPAVATGGIFVVIPALLYAVFGLFVGLAVIIIRRMIIIMLIVASPIAAVLWILPGTEGLGKRWWKTFIQMLMIYPIMMAFIGSGVLVSGIMLNVGNGGFFQGLSALVALIAPFVLLPTVFKLATSTLGNLTGMLNNKSKGLVDRGANWGRDKSKSTGAAQEKERKKQDRTKAKYQRRAGNKSAINFDPATGERRSFGGRQAEKWRRRASPISRAGETWEHRRDSRRADDEVYRAESTQFGSRGATAADATRKIQSDAASLRLRESQHDVAASEITDETGAVISAAGHAKDTDDIYTRLAQGQQLTVTGADGVRRQLGGGNAAEQQATRQNALNQLASYGRDGVLAEMMPDPTTGAAPVRAGIDQSQLQQAINDNAGALMGKAPDLVKGPAPAFRDGMSSGTLKSLSAAAIQRGQAHGDTDAATRTATAAAAQSLVDPANSVEFGAMTRASAHQLADTLDHWAATHGTAVAPGVVTALRGK